MSVYTADSPITGTGVASAPTISDWFAKYGYCPTNLGAQITMNAALAGLNSDLLAAQIAHETGYWTSAIAKDKLNPAGIGAENDDPYNKAITFPTVAAGILAMVDHLLTYIKGDGPWTAQDPRYAAVKAAGWLGSVRVLSDLDGKWAYPGQGYGASIAALANALVAFGGQTGGAPMAGDDPRFDWKPDTTEFGYPTAGTHGRDGYAIDLLILHFTAGSDSESTLLGKNNSSTHYLTYSDGKPREQNVLEADAAWTPGNRVYACRSINLEVEKEANAPWTDALVREVAHTAAPIIQRNALPVAYLARDNGAGKRGLIGHRDVPDPDHPGQWGGSGHHSDPGGPPDGGPEFPWDTFLGYVNAELGGTDVPATYATYFPETQHSVGGGFRTFWTANGGLPIFGYPLTDEIQEAGTTVQYFERAVFEFHPENAAPFDILLRRLGAAALDAKAAAQPPTPAAT